MCAPERLLPRLRSDEQGSTVVEFAMMSILLTALFLAALQVAVYVYARSVVAASAADGARYGANAEVDVRAGADRASSIVRAGLSGSAAALIPCSAQSSVDVASGLPTVTVRCRGSVRAVLLPFRLPMVIDVSASALKESLR